MQSLEVSLTRWDDGWLVELPALSAFTRTAHLRDAATAAHRCATAHLGSLPDLVDVTVTRIDFAPDDHVAAAEVAELAEAARASRVSRSSKETRSSAAGNAAAARLRSVLRRATA